MFAVGVMVVNNPYHANRSRAASLAWIYRINVMGNILNHLQYIVEVRLKGRAIPEEFPTFLLEFPRMRNFLKLLKAVNGNHEAAFDALYDEEFKALKASRESFGLEWDLRQFEEERTLSLYAAAHDLTDEEKSIPAIGLEFDGYFAPLRVNRVIEGSVAEKVGFRKGDLILSFESVPLPNRRFFRDVWGKAWKKSVEGSLPLETGLTAEVERDRTKVRLPLGE